ncbi:MAG: type I restriction-modification system subunit M N-terminal domain-containing protein [Kiritimatiellales bacterium]
MSGDQKRQLEQQLWNIANELRGKMNADEFRDYILGFIFYKYLSEKQYLYANKLLKGEKTDDYRRLTDQELLAAIKNESLETLGYFLLPDQLFDALAKKGNSKESKAGEAEAASNYILDELDAVLTHIEQSTMGTESEEEFTALFEDMDLQSTCFTERAFRTAFLCSKSAARKTTRFSSSTPAAKTALKRLKTRTSCAMKMLI